MAKATKKKNAKQKPVVKVDQPTLVKGQFGEVVKVKLNPPRLPKKKAAKKKK